MKALIETLVELYDRDMLKNILGIHLLHPKKAVFIFDDSVVEQHIIDGLTRSLTRKLKDLSIEWHVVDGDSLDSVYHTCQQISVRNPGCAFDLTGGNKLMDVGAYDFCKSQKVPMFYLDTATQRIINLGGFDTESRSFDYPRLAFEDILVAKGAGLIKSGRKSPPPEQQDSVLSACRLIFDNVERWKQLCKYFQLSSANENPLNTLLVSAPITITANGKRYQADVNYMYEFAELGLIKNVEVNAKRISYQFTNELYKSYLIDYGIWLELYVYIMAVKSRKFDDINMSVRIDWDGERVDFSHVENEIDVVICANSKPMFISCKLSAPSVEALNELKVYSQLFGTEETAAVMITLGDMHADRLSVLKRALEMGISVIDQNDIHQDKLIDRLSSILFSKNR